MAVFVHKTATGAIWGADPERIFVIGARGGPLPDVSEMDKAPRMLLQHAMKNVPKDCIRYVQAIDLPGCPIRVEGSGGDSSRFNYVIFDRDAQIAFMDFVAREMGLVRTESKANPMQAAPVLFPTAIVAGCLTLLAASIAFMSTTEQMQRTYNEARSRAGERIIEGLFSQLYLSVGAFGILFLGLLITAIPAGLVYRQYCKGIRVLRLTPSPR